MDNFMVDIDAVLDEFEQSESCSNSRISECVLSPTPAPVSAGLCQDRLEVCNGTSSPLSSSSPLSLGQAQPMAAGSIPQRFQASPRSSPASVVSDDPVQSSIVSTTTVNSLLLSGSSSIAARDPSALDSEVPHTRTTTATTKSTAAVAETTTAAVAETTTTAAAETTTITASETTKSVAAETTTTATAETVMKPAIATETTTTPAIATTTATAATADTITTPAIATETTTTPTVATTTTATTTTTTTMLTTTSNDSTETRSSELVTRPALSAAVSAKPPSEPAATTPPATSDMVVLAAAEANEPAVADQHVAKTEQRHEERHRLPPPSTPGSTPRQCAESPVATERRSTNEAPVDKLANSDRTPTKAPTRRATVTASFTEFSPATSSKQIRAASTTDATMNSISPAVKPKTLSQSQRVVAPPTGPMSPGVSSEQFEEFLRKKSLENAHLLAGSNSPVLQRYRSSPTAIGRSAMNATATTDDDDVNSTKKVARRSTRQALAGDATRPAPLRDCDTVSVTPSECPRPAAEEGLPTQAKSTPTERLTSTNTEIRSPGDETHVAETQKPTAIGVSSSPRTEVQGEGMPSNDQLESCVNNTKRFQPHDEERLNHAHTTYADDSFMADASGDRGSIEVEPSGRQVLDDEGETSQLHSHLLKSDASNYYRIVSFDLSSIEVTDDDLTKLEDELRMDDGAPSSRSQDPNSKSIEAKASEQVVTSWAADNIANNNDGITSSSKNNASSDAPSAEMNVKSLDNPFVVVEGSEVSGIAGNHQQMGADDGLGQTRKGSNDPAQLQTTNETLNAAQHHASASHQVTSKSEAESASDSQSSPQSPEASDVAVEKAQSGSGAVDERQPAPDRGQELPVQRSNDGELTEQGGTGGDADAAVMSPSEVQLGKVRPLWIQDEDAPICMNCGQDFTMFRRRHHCRACGKVLCSNCCKDRARLEFMGSEPARVCTYCIEILNKAQLPPPPTVMVPVGVLKKGGERSGSTYSAGGAAVSGVGMGSNSGGLSSSGGSGSKSVVFSDGIRPGGDLTDLDIPSTPPAQRAPHRTLKQVATPARSKGSVKRKFRLYTSVSDSLGSLPNVLLSNESFLPEQPMTVDTLFNLLQDSSLPPVGFGLTRNNLRVRAKIVDLECCVGRRVWSFCSSGLAAFGQEEVVLVLEWHQDDELAVPRDVFKLYRVLFENACRGTPVSAMDHLLFPGGLLGSSEHTGFLFVRASLQCTERLVTPNPLREGTYLVALLILKTEVPWAKLFPLRLLLRLGAEFRYYPCPLTSTRFRKPVYFEGDHHSIMNILADFRNYQYTIQNIPGLVIHMVGKKTTIYTPRNRYELMMKASTTNENILALGANFSPSADSHLVCTQAEDGSFQSQTINIAPTQAKVIGASFVVFSGALKSNSGFTAKSSIVEDGLLVQISPYDMSRLKQAIHDMSDYRIVCKQTASSSAASNANKVAAAAGDGNVAGAATAASAASAAQSTGTETQNCSSDLNDDDEECIELKWAANERTQNEGVISVLDGASLAGVPSCRIFSGTDYSNDRFLVRWTEVFFLASKDTELDLPDPNRLIEATARSMCVALVPNAAKLYEMDLTKLALRINLDPEQFGYEIGAGGSTLAPEFLGEVDNALVPIITSLDGSHQPMTIELVFYVLLK